MESMAHVMIFHGYVGHHQKVQELERKQTAERNNGHSASGLFHTPRMGGDSLPQKFLFVSGKAM